MKLQFIGTGSAFTVGVGNHQSNMLFKSRTGRTLLLDCGTDVRLSLYELGLIYRDIDDVYISHLHSDHVGGIEWLGFSTKYDPRCAKPIMYINEFICDDLWNHVLAGGMGALQGGTGKLETFFTVQKLKRDGAFIWQGIEFKQVETIHIVNGPLITPSFGLAFTVNGHQTFLTTDSQYTPDHLAAAFAEADLIFHDCEILKHRTGVHANYQDLRTLDSKIKAKMWLYHYNPGQLPDAQADGFRGFVLKGQEFDLADPRIYS